MHLQINENLKNTAAIIVDNVSFAYQKTVILNQVSFEIHEGQFIGIIGPNGGGKTTLLKLLMGFLKPISGTIRIFGKNSIDTTAYKNRLSYVPQTIRYDREFPISVEEVVLSGLISHLPWYGKFRSRELNKAREALKLVGLEHLSHYAFGTLSGGQAQRVLIARALVSDPQILLLDEPTASVDNQAEADIYAILKELKGKMTILMVTHDLEAAVAVVDRVICMQKQAYSLQPKEICQHFALGLYHKPLL